MQRFPRLLRLPGRLRPVTLFGASGLLLGIWGASYVFSTTPNTINLDSDARSQSRLIKAQATRSSDTSDTLRQQKALHLFNKAQYGCDDARLHEHEQSVECEEEVGVSRYDVVQIASNNPTEDDHAELIVPVPNGYWSMFAVFDGHNGWETSAWLRENMLSAVLGALSDLYSQVKGSSSSPSAPNANPTPGDIEETLKQTFQRLDDDIVHTALQKVFASPSRHAAANILAPANAGSCALLAFYDSHSHLLHVAVTGDSRAVLGRKVPNADGKGHHYEVRELSVDQNGWNPAEQTRLAAQHPGELLVKDGRVMGWGMSRAFGDAKTKWTPDVQTRLKREYLGRSVSPDLKTPPYIIAAPEVTCTEIQKGDFLILATDGLWEALTSEQAVGLVGWWLDSRDSSRHGLSSNGKLDTLIPQELPIDPNYEDKTARYRQWNIEKRFTDKDDNAGTHLIRNALGGANEDVTSALLSMRAPRARWLMDDITATVVFFDK